MCKCLIVIVARGRFFASLHEAQEVRWVALQWKSLCSLRSQRSFSLNALSSKLEAIHEKSPPDFV